LTSVPAPTLVLKFHGSPIVINVYFFVHIFPGTGKSLKSSMD